MTFPAAAGWISGVVFVACVLWTFVKSVHLKVNVRVRTLTPGETDGTPSDEPKVSFEKQLRVEHGKPIRFGTRANPPK